MSHRTLNIYVCDGCGLEQPETPGRGGYPNEHWMTAFAGGGFEGYDLCQKCAAPLRSLSAAVRARKSPYEWKRLNPGKELPLLDEWTWPTKPEETP